jgi:coenzyme Q-binding protein COQ10
MMKKCLRLLTTCIYRKESAYIGFAPEQIFAVVSDVANYKSFLPWCTNAIVLTNTSRFDDESEKTLTDMEATLEVGFPPFFKEQYTSSITMEHTNRIQARLHEKSHNQLLSDLICDWQFAVNRAAPRSAKVTFDLTFSFSSAAHQSVTNMVFNKIAQMMSDAFIKRCEDVYGLPSHAKRVISCVTSNEAKPPATSGTAAAPHSYSTTPPPPPTSH